MHPQWRYLRSRIEYTIARPRVGCVRGELGCGVHGETHQSLGKHAKASRWKCEFDQIREVPFVPKADDLALATSHLAQSSSASRVTAGASGFFILSQSGERPER